MKILIVDDEVLIRRSLLRALSLKGYIVDEAENGIIALQKLTAEKFDAIVLDMMMPEKNGYEVLQELNQDIPIVIISAFTGEELNQDLFKNDARVKLVIKKPFADLFTTTEEILKCFSESKK